MQTEPATAYPATSPAPSPAASPADRLASIRRAVAPELARVDERILKSLASRTPLIEEMGRHLIAQGGKRIRPLLTLLSARAFGCAGSAPVEFATVIEFIHAATLMHDDVVDRSALRRGHETANAIWGNEASVLVGDFLYSRAFQIMVAVGNHRFMQLMADTTNVIAEGEVLQLANRHDPATTEARYLEIIGYKTGRLFEAAARVGPLLAPDASEADERAMGEFGAHLGLAYQLVDDVFDYRGSAATIGKNIGDDLADGSPTLPLIHALRAGDADTVRTVGDALRAGDVERLPEVIRAVESSGGIEYTLALARKRVEQAREALRNIPDNRFRSELSALADFVIERAY